MLRQRRSKYQGRFWSATYQFVRCAAKVRYSKFASIALGPVWAECGPSRRLRRMPSLGQVSRLPATERAVGPRLLFAFLIVDTGILNG